MAQVTTTKTIIASAWTEIGAAAEQILFTPEKFGFSIWVRFKATDPGAGVTNGHHFVVGQSENKNSIIGSVNTEKIWARLANPNNPDITSFITIL